MSYAFPLLLKKGSVLLIGAGKAALKKAQVLQKNRVSFKVVAKKFNKEFDTIYANKYQKNFSCYDVDYCDIVIDATGDPLVAKVLTILKQEKKFLLNIVDKPEMCDFYFTAQADLGNLKISVSSDGASPTMAQIVRDKIQRYLPRDLELLSLKYQKERVDGRINIEQVSRETTKIFGKLYIFCTDCADFDDLTLRVYKHLKILDYLYLNKNETHLHFYYRLSLENIVTRDLKCNNFNKLLSAIRKDTDKGMNIGLLTPCKNRSKLQHALKTSGILHEIIG